MGMKYYLKGLGIGMIVATLLMVVATKNTVSMTDDEIKARAKELGMVEQKTLSDMVEDSTPDSKPESTEDTLPITTKEPVQTPPAISEEPVDTEVPIDTEPPAASEEPSATAAPEDNAEMEYKEQGNEEEQAGQTEQIVLEIKNGDSSDSVCARLQELGIIEDGGAFNRYLCNKGYDTKLNIGSYQLNNGMSDEEIAKIITRTK